jgi:hypothetical protein
VSWVTLEQRISSIQFRFSYYPIRLVIWSLSERVIRNGGKKEKERK